MILEYLLQEHVHHVIGDVVEALTNYGDDGGDGGDGDDSDDDDDIPEGCTGAWVGDGICDPACNFDGYDYDGGDCCQESPEEGWDSYCDETNEDDCDCKNPAGTTETPA